MTATTSASTPFAVFEGQRRNIVSPHRISARTMAFWVVLWLPGSALAGGSTVVGTPHDLSSGGPLLDRSGSESDVCIFCHISHGASVEGPLWSRPPSTSAYVVYSSETLKTGVDQPDGNSKLCLSCHDGTLAVNSVRGGAVGDSRTISMGAGRELSSSGQLATGRLSNLGWDLSDDHPISFVFDTALSLRDQQLVAPETSPSGLGGSVTSDLLDGNRKVQCTTCHNAHDNSIGNFLRVSSRGAALCLICHQRLDYNLSAHNSGQSAQFDDNCLVCHSEHGGSPSSPLLVKAQRDLCATCHLRQATATGPTMATRHATDANLSSLNRGMSCGTCHEPHNVRTLTLYERKILTTPNTNLRPRPLVAEEQVPHSYRDEPYLAAEDGETFCMECHGGTWPGAANIQAELMSNSIQTQFTDGVRSLHYLHTKRATDAPGQPFSTSSGGTQVTQPGTRVGCTYCHDAHGTTGNRGVPRGRLLYDWLTVNEFPYRAKASCSTSDVLMRCHGPG